MGATRWPTGTGVELVLIDDQTITTRNAIRLMQNNALIGLVLVLVVTWLFLGSRIALLTSIGIPFILAGTFWVLVGHRRDTQCDGAAWRGHRARHAGR